DDGLVSRLSSRARTKSAAARIHHQHDLEARREGSGSGGPRAGGGFPAPHEDELHGMSPLEEKPAPLVMWRSLEELAAGGWAASREAPADLGWSRRDFLTLVGASGAMAALGGCFREPPEKIMPYTHQPAEVKPGVPLHYATSIAMGHDAIGL